VQAASQFANAGVDVFLAAQLQGRGDVVKHLHRGVVDELLVHHGHVALAHRHPHHVTPIHHHPPGGGHIQPGHDAHQLVLPACRAQQYRHGIALQRQAHVIQPGLRPDFLADAVQRQLHEASSSAPWACVKGLRT
jgi:hypothetical protein